MHSHALATIKPINLADAMRNDYRFQQQLKNITAWENNPNEQHHFDVAHAVRTVQPIFAEKVACKVFDLMVPFYTEYYAPASTNFVDLTEQLKKKYFSDQTVECIQLSNGKIVDASNYPYNLQYVIRDGKVYETNWGKLRTEKMTRKTRKMKVLPGMTMQKIYKSFEKFATNGYGYEYDPEVQGYGFYYNPSAMWDWYQIGGRWPADFLVKDNCCFYSNGERSWCNKETELPCPDGYMWVSAARKKDIQWEVMQQWNTAKLTEAFDWFKKMLITNEVEHDYYAVTEQGLTCYGDLILKRDETLDEFLTKRYCHPSQKYSICVCDFITNDSWEHIDPDTSDSYENALSEFIDSIDDEDILVSVDYHM